MQKLPFSGLLGSPTPEATPKFYPLHPKLRMKTSTIFPHLEQIKVLIIKYYENSVIIIEYNICEENSVIKV